MKYSRHCVTVGRKRSRATEEDLSRERRFVLDDPHNPGAFLIRVDDTDQSWVDPSEPTRLEFDYMRWIADYLDTVAPPAQRLRAVHIGGAGMSLARYVAATRPTSAQIVCEPDEELVEQVRRVAPLPPRSGIKVRTVDGRSGVTAMPDDYCDVLIIDAFRGGRTPGELVTTQAFDHWARVMKSDGVVLLNLGDKQPFEWLRDVYAALSPRFPHRALSAEPSLLRGRRFANAVLVGSGRALPQQRIAQAGARATFPYRTVNDAELDRFLVGGRAMDDDDYRDSPAMPGKGHALW